MTPEEAVKRAIVLLEQGREQMHRYDAECWQIEQTLGRALGYPRFCDDPTNFPGATEADGVCVGEHTAVTLAEEAAQRLMSRKESCEQEIPTGTSGVPLLTRGHHRRDG